MNIEDIKDFDISAKNPNKKAEAEIRKPTEIMQELKDNEKLIEKALNELEGILRK